MNKTPEEILTLKFEGFQTQIPVPLHAIQRAFIIAAMEEYASQEVAEKDKEISLLKFATGDYEIRLDAKDEKIKELEAENSLLKTIAGIKTIDPFQDSATEQGDCWREVVTNVYAAEGTGIRNTVYSLKKLFNITRKVGV